MSSSTYQDPDPQWTDVMHHAAIEDGLRTSLSEYEVHTLQDSYAISRTARLAAADGPVTAATYARAYQSARLAGELEARDLRNAKRAARRAMR